MKNAMIIARAKNGFAVISKCRITSYINSCAGGSKFFRVVVINPYRTANNTCNDVLCPITVCKLKVTCLQF
jgi:hypothetical protein